MREVPKFLFLCHGRLHPRSIHWWPALASKKDVWENAIYIDLNERVWPDHHIDLTKDHRNLFKQEFDCIVAVNCIYWVYVKKDIPELQKNFWLNVAAWLKPGGHYVNSAPCFILKPRFPDMNPRRIDPVTRCMKELTVGTSRDIGRLDYVIVYDILDIAKKRRLSRDENRILGAAIEYEPMYAEVLKWGKTRSSMVQHSLSPEHQEYLDILRSDIEVLTDLKKSPCPRGMLNRNGAMFAMCFRKKF